MWSTSSGTWRLPHTWYGDKTRLVGQLPQTLLSWSGHVLSWIEEAPVPVHVMRYEDMQAQPLTTFTEAVRFCGLEHSETEIEAALRVSAFERLQELERKGGFREKPSTCTHFFREVGVGFWREALTDAQVERLIMAHGATMRRLGYLDASDKSLW